jgi:hypothetical protein
LLSAKKEFQFYESFSNWPWPAFKSGGHCAASFSIENCSSETDLAGLKIGQIGPGWLSKAIDTVPRICYLIRAKDLNMPAFKSFGQIKSFLR